MSYDTGIANRLRAKGVPVIECAGWTTRGSSSFGPHGSVNHHTAGSPNGATPSLNLCINGRPDLAGPLCNVFQSREPGEGNDVAYVVAAGRANHAGEGGWMGLSGNSSVYGLEIEHTGVEPLPMHRQETAARIHAAMFAGDPRYVCQHFEWTTRKIDAAQGVDPEWFRGRVAYYEQGGPPPGDEDEMTDADWVRIEQLIAKYTHGLKPVIVAFDDVTPGDPDYWFSVPAQTRSEETKDTASQRVAEGNARWWDQEGEPLRIPRATLKPVPLIGESDE